MNTFDFEYSAPDGSPLIVEVDYFYSEPDPYATDSDWDYKGEFYIEAIRVYSGMVELNDIEIHSDVIYTKFKKYLKDAELEYVIEGNDYF